MEKKDMEYEGKQVFFLYPHSVIKDDIVNFMIWNEYEIYFLKDHEKALKLIDKFYKSILFINIDDKLKSEEWIDYVKKIQSGKKTRNVRIGILSYNEDPALAETFLMDLGVSCGFIQLKLGIEQSKKILLSTLEANEAKGKRKFIRANCSQSDRVTFNVKYKDTVIKGKIQDISIVGAALQFEQSLSIKKGTVLQDLSLNLKGKHSKVDCIVYGTRADAEDCFIVLFKNKGNQFFKEKIHEFIHRFLHDEMDSILRKL